MYHKRHGSSSVAGGRDGSPSALLLPAGSVRLQYLQHEVNAQEPTAGLLP